MNTPGLTSILSHLRSEEKVQKKLVMKLTLVIFAAVICCVIGAPSRAKRQAYELPDGADIIVGPIKTSFQCPGSGYYADMDNNCQIFHVCSLNAGVMHQFSFMCGNQTVFNQFSTTCAMLEDSIPCSESSNFFYTNERIGDPKQYFLDEADFQRAAQLIPSLYNQLGGGGGGGAAVNTATGGRGRGR